MFLDQWMAHHGWSVDDQFVCQFCTSNEYRDSHIFDTFLVWYDDIQGTAQLAVAGAGIYHPEWVATAWQTCTFPDLR